MKKRKHWWIFLVIFVLAISLILIAASVRVNIKTSHLSDDYQKLYQDIDFAQPVSVSNISVIRQDISCGYAVIEMFAQWARKDVTEESLFDNYGKITASTGKSFEKQMNRQFPEYKTTMYKYQTNSQMLEKIYNSLKNGIPVPFEWAAQTDNTWTLHYSLISGLNFGSDEITVLNPYGYQEVLPIAEFLKRTSFEAYENMPLFLKMGFMFGVFEKNTIFVVEE